MLETTVDPPVALSPPLLFASHAIRIEEVIERPRSEWLPRPNRSATSTTGMAYRMDGSRVRVHMTDLSYDGCHLLTEHRLDVGETMQLSFPGSMQVPVQVRWVKDNEAGVRFLHNASAAEARRARLGF